MINITIQESIEDIKRRANNLRKRWLEFRPKVIAFTQAADKALEDHRPRKMLGDKILNIEEIAMCRKTLCAAGLSEETELMTTFYHLLHQSLELREKCAKLTEILRENIEDRSKEERIRCLRIINRGLIDWKECAPKMPFRLNVHPDISDRLTVRAKGQCGLLISLVPRSLDSCQHFIKCVERGWMSLHQTPMHLVEKLGSRQSRQSFSSDRSVGSDLEIQTDLLSAISSPTPTQRTTTTLTDSHTLSFDNENYRNICLEEYSKRIANLESSRTLRDLNFTTSIFAAGLIGREGGTLTIPESQVSICLPRIPSSGLADDDISIDVFNMENDVNLDEMNKDFQVHVYVDPERNVSVLPPLAAKQTFVSPLIRCGPLGTSLNRPAIVTIPHCVLEIDKWFFQAYYKDDDCESEVWKKVADNRTMHFLVGEKNCVLLTNRLVDVQIVGEVNHVIETPKLLRLGVFSVAENISCDICHFRICAWNNTAADTQVVNVLEKGTRLCQDVEFEVHSRGQDIILTLGKVDPHGWKIGDNRLTQTIDMGKLWNTSTAAISRSYQFEYYGRELAPSISVEIGIKQKNSISKNAMLKVHRTTSEVSETTNDVTVTYGYEDKSRSETRSQGLAWPSESFEVQLEEIIKPDQLLHPDIHRHVCSSLATNHNRQQHSNTILTERGRNSTSSNLSSTSSYQIGQPRIRHCALKATELVEGCTTTASHHSGPIRNDEYTNFPKDYRGLAVTLGLSSRTIFWISKQNFPESTLLEYFHVTHSSNNRRRLDALSDLHRLSDKIGNQSVSILIAEAIHRVLVDDEEEEQAIETDCQKEERDEVERRRNSLLQKSEHLKTRVRRESVHLENEEVQGDINRSIILIDDRLGRVGGSVRKVHSTERKVQDLEDKLDNEIGKFTVSTKASIQKRLFKLKDKVNQAFTQDNNRQQKYLMEIERLQDNLSTPKKNIDNLIKLTKGVEQLEQTISGDANTYLTTLAMSIRQRLTVFRDAVKKETMYFPDVAEPCKDSLKRIEYALTVAKTSGKELYKLRKSLEETESHFRERIVRKSRNLYEEIMAKLKSVTKIIDEMENDRDVQTLRASVKRLQQEANESFGFLVQLQELLWQVDRLKVNVTDILKEQSVSMKTTLTAQVETLQRTVDEDVGDDETTYNMQRTLTRVGKECKLHRTSLTKLRKMSSYLSFMERNIDETRKMEIKLNSKLENKLVQLHKQLPTLASYEDVQKFKVELVKLEDEKAKNKPSTVELKCFYQKAVDIERRMETEAEMNHTKNTLLLKLRHLEKSLKTVQPRSLAEELLNKVVRFRNNIVRTDKTLPKIKKMASDLDKLEVKVKGFLSGCVPANIDYNLLDKIAEIVQPIWIPTNGLEMPELKHALLIKEAGIRGDAQSMLKESYKRRNGKLKWESLLRVVRELDPEGHVEMQLREMRALSGNGKI
ncbi:uncharacterized protein [Ptychodera flava]|uniref:uncharacterized protein isoform X2 n=1 Tax=Ptychodera flava TaxID=63121 RepID=UPI00396A8B51